MITSAIIDQIYANVNRTDLTRAMIIQYLANRQDQICNFDNFSFMEKDTTKATEDGVQFYALPTDYKDELIIYIVEGTTKKQLSKWVGSEAERNFSKTTTEGKPYAYWVWDDKIWLYPIPDAVYTLTYRYYQYLTDLTDASTEENELCSRWSDLLINGATSDAFHFFLMPDKTSEWETKWQSEFSKLVRRQGKKRYSNYQPRLRIRIK
jgi:hypothetical protein